MSIHMKEKAIILRRKGFSYSDISNQLGISKASISKWLKNYRLTPEESLILASNIKNRIEKGRMKASINIRSNRMYKERVVYDEARKEFEKNVNDSFFSFGLALYEGHGTKNVNYFNFSHSDPSFHSIILVWIIKFLKIDKEKLKFRLFLHENENQVELIEFWSSILDMPEEKFKSTAYRRGLGVSKDKAKYKGMLSLMYMDVKVVRKIDAWQKLLIQYYKGK